MIDEIDYDIIDDIVKVCSQPGREMWPARLPRKLYHKAGGNFSCGAINDRGSFAWFCAAATLVLDGVDLRKQPASPQWQRLLDCREHGIAASKYMRREVEFVPAPAKRPASARRPQGVDTSPAGVVRAAMELRRVAEAMSVPVASLTQSDYLSHGGQLTDSNVTCLGGWRPLRAAAVLLDDVAGARPSSLPARAA